MKEEYLWKYLSLDKFCSLLENNGFYFTTIKNLKLNLEPDECSILEHYLKYQQDSISEMQNSIKNDEVLYNQLEKNKQDFFNICDDALENIFVCSFTNDSIENYALWKIYPTDLKGNQQVNQGIAICISRSHFIDIIQKPQFVLDDGTIFTQYKVFLKKMKYKSREKIIEHSKQLLNSNSCQTFYDLIHSSKIEYYQYENEERAIIQLFSENKKYSKGGFLKLNLREFFEVNQVKIYVSPFATKSLSSYVEFLLKKYGLNTAIIQKQSEIRVCK